MGYPIFRRAYLQVPGYTRPLPLPQGCKCLAAAAWNPVCHCWLPPWTLRTGRTRFSFKNGGQKSTRWLSFPEMIWYCKSHRGGDRTSSNPFCWGIEMSSWLVDLWIIYHDVWWHMMIWWSMMIFCVNCNFKSTWKYDFIGQGQGQCMGVWVFEKTWKPDCQVKARFVGCVFSRSLTRF